MNISPPSNPVWKLGDTVKPKPTDPQRAATLYRPDILEHIDKTIQRLDTKLRELSLEIHSRVLRWLIHAEDSFEILQVTPSSLSRSSTLTFLWCTEDLYLSLWFLWFSHTHDVLTAFISKHDFDVTKHYHLETAWKAEFSNGIGGRVIGVNSEVFYLVAPVLFISCVL